MQWVVTVADKPVAVIETLSNEQRRFDAIDEAFAREEGEGDRSLTFWHSVHEDFFQSEGRFAQDMMSIFGHLQHHTICFVADPTTSRV
jgi:uncharacterized protein YhfF